MNSVAIYESKYEFSKYEFPKAEIQCRVSDPKFLPARANPTDAGADLLCTESFTLNPGSTYLADTGVAVKIPVGFAGFVLNRSSQRVKGITSLGTGLIDSDYRGNLKVYLKNDGKDQYQVEAGITKIAQLVIVPVRLPVFVDSWNDTSRGEGGFGSTDKK